MVWFGYHLHLYLPCSSPVCCSFILTYTYSHEFDFSPNLCMKRGVIEGPVGEHFMVWFGKIYHLHLYLPCNPPVCCSFIHTYCTVHIQYSHQFDFSPNLFMNMRDNVGLIGQLSWFGLVKFVTCSCVYTLQSSYLLLFDSHLHIIA